MNTCPVCGALCASLPHCCGSIGPRIGEGAPRCVLTPGHDGDHEPHESWRSVGRWSNDKAPPAWTHMTVRATELERGDRLWFTPSRAVAVEETWRDDFDEQIFVRLDDFRWPLVIPVDEPVEIERALDQ